MRRSILPGLSLALATVLLAPAAAQAQRPELTLSGQLLDATTRTPVRAGVVELTGTKRRVLADSSGRFFFSRVPAGDHAFVASALGYQKTVVPALPGSPALVLLLPEPVPLKAIEALAQPGKRSVRGVPQWVFGREQLLSGGDISAAEFVRWKVPMIVRPCQSFDWGRETTATLAIDAGSGVMRIGRVATDIPKGPPDGMLGNDCIYGPRHTTSPVMVVVDDEPVRYSEELWQYRAWDLGRAEVMYQRSPSGAVRAPFALVHLYTTQYLARVAGRAQGICDRRSLAGATGTVADSALAALCGR